MFCVSYFDYRQLKQLLLVPNLNIILIMLINISDKRKSACYLDYRRGKCTQGLDGLFTKSLCCCTVGRAWSDQCTPCPSKGSGKLHVSMSSGSLHKSYQSSPKGPNWLCPGDQEFPLTYNGKNFKKSSMKP